MPSTSPYIAGCAMQDEEDVALWRRHHSDDPRASPVYWTDRKSLGTSDVTTTISNNNNNSSSSELKQRTQLHHRFSAPSLQPSARPSSASTTTSSSSTSTGFRPWSSAGSSGSSLADDGSGSPLTTTSVRFLGVSKKESHCVYLVQVDTGTEQFVVHKRYSQFRDFRQELFAALERQDHCGNGPCKQLLQLTQIKFPRRKHRLLQWKKDADLLVAKERLLLLQRFVEAMLRVYRMASRRQLRCCVNTKCVAMETIRTFLRIADADESAVAAALAMRASMGQLLPTRSDPELLQVRNSSPERDVDVKNVPTAAEPSRRQSRGFPPPTRASLPPTDADHQFEQLYTITEDTELHHLHA